MIYRYAHCNKEWDEIRWYGEKDNVFCPNCGKKAQRYAIYPGCSPQVAQEMLLTDPSGEIVHFKEPYYDRALRQQFNTKREKAEYMHKHRIRYDGSSDKELTKKMNFYKESGIGLAKKEGKK
jgi:hypothetical protein